MYDLDTALLRSFVLLAETRSFSRTAERVGRSQSAISAQMKKLEAMMGANLIERDTRNVALTTAGERLLGHAREIVGSTDRMIARFRSSDLTGEVRFGSPEDFASAHLPPILSEFAVTNDRILLHVSCDLTVPLLKAFEAGEFDLVIVKQDPRQLYPGAQVLLEEHLAWTGSPAKTRDFAAAWSEAAALGRTLPLVLSPAPCVYRSRATMALDAAGVSWSIVYQSPSEAGLVAAMKAGLGFSVMPLERIPADLRALTAGWPLLDPAVICLLTNPRLSPPAAALAEHMARSLKDWPM